MKKIIISLFAIGFLAACGSGNSTDNSEEKAYEKVDGVAVDMEDKGIGPVSSVDLSGDVDEAMAQRGKELFNASCTACHRADQKLIGPAPKGVLDRRSPEWVMNMILNPDEMVKKNPIAKQLLREYNNAPMTNQGLTEEETRAVLEYFRTL